MDEKDLLSVDEFAEAIKLKHPEYKDVDNATLVSKMIEKYPEYKDRVSMDSTPTQLTPEMMETGKRDAAPAYAMTEEKYAAEKKSPTESPSQDGVSADVVEEPVAEGPVVEELPEDFDLAAELRKQTEIVGRDTREYGYIDPRKQMGAYPTKEFLDRANKQLLADQEFTAKKMETEDISLADIQKQEKAQAEEERLLTEKERYELNLDEDFLKDTEMASFDMMGKKEEEVVPMMNDIYSKYGFSFRETGIDNEMQVIAKNGEKTFIELKPILKSDQIDSSRRLQKFLKDNAVPVTKEVAEVEKNEIKNAARALNLRKVGRLNDDGTESTVLMASGEVDGKYVAYPTLFPKDPKNYTSAASSWMELDGMDAIREAKNRNELFYFDTEKEAQEFAEGSWKGFSNADAEADLFFEKKGLNYMAYKDSYEQFENALDRSEFLKEAPRFEDELTEDEVKKYGDLYVNGTLRSDAGKIQEELEKKADGLRDFVNDKDYLVTRYELDSYMQEKHEKKAQIAVTTNNISKAQIEKANDMSVEFFGVPLNELSKYQPKTNEEVDKINSIVETYNDAMTTRQMAANQYDVANTYLNEKFEKSIHGQWIENGAAFNDAVKKGWYNGRAAEAILWESLGMTDASESGMSWNDMSSKEVAQKIVDALSQTETGKNSIVAQRYHSAKNFKDILDTFKDDPLELTLTWAAESMAQMLPYALKIVPTTTAVGAGIGGGMGLTGFMAGPAGIATTGGGVLVGGAKGFQSGMAAVAFSMEYTNAVLDAIRNSDKGYDIMNVDDVAAALQDENIWIEGREIGLKRGIPIAVVDYLSSGLAGRVFKVGSVASKSTRLAAGVGERFVFDPVSEGIGELAAQITAGQDVELKEILAEMGGSIGSNTSMAAINMYMDARNKTNVGIANDLSDISFMANESSSDGAITKWANNMERLGHITAEQNQRIQENVALRREAGDLLNVGSGKVPMPFTASNKVQARTMELLAARDELTSTQNRRAVFGSKVAEINAELQEIVTNKKLRPKDKQTVLAGSGVTEASRQAIGADIREGIKTYTVNGKAYTREEFLSRIADMSEKQLKKANVAVKNDDSVIDILRKKGKEIAQKIEETSVLRPKGDDEGVDLTAPTYEAPTQVTSPIAEEFATVNRNDGKGTVTLTEDEYNAEMEKFAPVEEKVKKEVEGIGDAVGKYSEELNDAIGDDQTKGHSEHELEKGEKEFLLDYTSSSNEGVKDVTDITADYKRNGHAVINKILRNGGDVTVESVMKEKPNWGEESSSRFVEEYNRMSDVIDKTKVTPTKSPVKLFRAFFKSEGFDSSEISNLEVGDTYSDDAMLSTTIDEDFFKKHKEGSFDVDMEIDIPVGESVNGVYVFGVEREFIIKGGVEFEVTGKTVDDNGKVTIKVKPKKQTKTEQDAVQEQGPEGVDVQEPAAESGAVGDGDVRQEPTREGDTEAEGQKITVEEEVQPVTDNPALKDVESTAQAFKDAETSEVTSDIAEAFGFEVKQGVEEKIAKAYHKAKADGTNPELVKAVEQSLKEPPVAEKPKKESKATVTKEVAQEAEDLANALGLGDDMQFSLGTDESGPINATIDFQSRLGKPFSTSKEFKDQNHMDNYIRFMERKGNKEVGIKVEGKVDKAVNTAKKRRFANRAVVTVGNVTAGEVTLEVGKIKPIMVDGNEFARMSKISVPSDNKFAFTEMELYTKAMDLAISEGLSGVIVSKELFNEAAVDENRFDIAEKTNNVLITPKDKGVGRMQERTPSLATKKEFIASLESAIAGNGDFAHMTAENPFNKQMGAAENKKRNEELKKELEERGYQPVAIDGFYDRSENSFYVRGMPLSEAMEIGAKYGQESVAHSEGMAYTTGEHAGTLEKSTGELNTGKLDNYYSDITTGDGSIKYNVGYDWGNYTKVDSKFQLETDVVGDSRKEALEKAAEELMNEVQPENVEAIDDAEPAAPITLDLTESNDAIKRTGIKRFKLSDIVGKMMNLVMADKLAIQLRDPSKPYNQDTNPYVKMGGPLFPLMEKLFGKVGWASITDAAATKIIKGAMNGDMSAVYNMGDSAVDSNIAMAESLDAKIPKSKKAEVFKLMKERVLGSKTEELKRAHGHFKSADTMIDALRSLAKDGDVKLRAAVMRLLVPSSNDGKSSIELYSMLSEMGISIESLRDENAEGFAKGAPDGAITMIVEVRDENGVPVRDLKLKLDKDLADGKITNKQYEKGISDIIKSAKMSLEQQSAEGIPSHPNYPVYIRGTAVAIMEETAPFFNIIEKYSNQLNDRLQGIEKMIGTGKKEGGVKKGATKIEASIYNDLQKVKSLIGSGRKAEARAILESMLNGDIKKLDKDTKLEATQHIKSLLGMNNKTEMTAKFRELLVLFANMVNYTKPNAISAAMTSGMTTATTAYEVSQHTKSTYERFVARLSKAFPSVETAISKEEFDQLMANARAKQLVTKSQKVYGAVYNGKLYLNPEFESYNTPVHEFGHVWLNIAKELSKETYKKGLELVKDSEYYYQVLNSKEYQKIVNKMREDGATQTEIDKYILEEALATAIGDKGESFASAARNKNFKNWLNELFEFIGKLTGISDLTPEQIQGMSLDEFTQGIVVDLLSGNELFAGAESTAFGEQLQLMTVSETSMNKIIEFGRSEGFSDAAIKELLRKRGFKVADINSSMSVSIDMETTLPSEFNGIEGGAANATKLFTDVKKKLSAFAKGKRKRLESKKLTTEEKKAKANELRAMNPSLFDMTDEEVLNKFPEPPKYEVISAPTMSEVREKAIELLKAHPIFQSQSKAVQDSILVGFDRTIGTSANKKIQDVINTIKNKIKAKREGVKSIKDAQEQFRQLLKGIPMSQDIRQIIKAIGDINQDNAIAQLERVSELIDKISAKDAKMDAQKQALKQQIAKMRSDARYLASLKNDMRRFIRHSLPLSNIYSKSQLDKVAAIIDNINADNHMEQAQKVFDIVEAQRTKMKKAKIKGILDMVRNAAKKKRISKKKAKAGSLEAQGQAFFTEAARILKLAYNSDFNGMIEVAQELSNIAEIDEIIEKEQRGDKLTVSEMAILDRLAAFDTLGDIMNMSLEEVMNLESALLDVRKESSIRLKSARLERSKRYSELSKNSINQVRNGFKDLFTINGILKTSNQLKEASKTILESFRNDGTFEAIKTLINNTGINNFNPLSWANTLIKEYVLHMGTMSTILDKKGSFFTDNIVTPLKDASERNMRGYQDQIKTLDNLANSIRGIDGGFKQIVKLLKGKGMFVAGIEQGTKADIDAIREGVMSGTTTLAEAKNLMAEAVRSRMEYLGMSKGDIKSQMKNIRDSVDAESMIREQVEYIDKISAIKQVDGITLTKGQLLRIYALSKNKVQRGKLASQGFTDAKIAEIEQFLGPELIAFADNVVDYLSGQYYDSVNNVHVKVNDVNLDYVENYFPTRSLRETRPPEFGEEQFGQKFNQNSPSAISQRVDNVSGVNLNYTFEGELKNHFKSMERYKAYAETVSIIQKILAFPHVNTLLEQTGLKAMYYMGIDNDVNPAASTPTRYDWLANRFYGMTLGFKLIQIPKQASSFINAYEQYSFFKDGKKKSFGVLGPDLMGFAYDMAKMMIFFRSNLRQARINSATFNQRVIDAFEGDVFGLESGIKLSPEQTNKFLQYWKTASAFPTTFGDVLGVMGYMAVYNRNIANGMSADEALKVFNDYNETQQSRRGTEASTIQIMTKKQPLLRMLTMFSSTMMLQINKAYQSSINIQRAISDGKIPNKKDVRSLYLNAGVANVMFVFAGNIMKLMDGDDEDKDEVYLEMVKAMFFINQVQRIPVIGSAITLAINRIEGKAYGSGAAGPLDKLVFDVLKAEKDGDTGEIFKRVLDFASGSNLDMFEGIIQGTTEGFEDEVVYDTIGLPKSARPKAKKEEKKEKKEKPRYKERSAKEYKERKYKERP